MSSSKNLTATLRISGMTCGSCELLLEKKLKAVPGVLAVDVQHRKGIAIITADANALPSSELIEETVRKAGYGTSDEVSHNTKSTVEENGVLKVSIDGMTTKDSENILKKKLRRVAGIQSATVQYKSGAAKIHYSHMPDWNDIREAVESGGYRLRRPHEAPTFPENARKKWIEIGGSLLIIFAIYKLLSIFDLISLAPSTSGALSLGGIFVIGLVAGTSSCLAVTGGLLLALAAKHNELHQAETGWQKFRPLLHFNLGRLASYFVLGGVVGVLGQSVSLSTTMSGVMSIAVALIMLWLALTILHIIPKGSFPLQPPKKLSRWIHNLSESDHPAAPFVLGAFTFFLPCGFTQSLQLVALASGNFLIGAFTMFTFALGTLPSLLGLSAVSSTTKGTTSRLFLRFSGALVLVLAFFNLSSGLALTGFNFSSVLNRPPSAIGAAPEIKNGMQEVSMSVTRSGYQPSNLTIKAGIPVKWMINGAGAMGCTSQIVIPDLGVTKALTTGINEINFTAQKPGQLAFSCSMGMVRGSFTVL